MYEIYVNIQEFTVDYCISVYVVFVHCVRSCYKLPHENPSQNTVHVTCMLHEISIDLHDQHNMHVMLYPRRLLLCCNKRQ